MSTCVEMSTVISLFVSCFLIVAVVDSRNIPGPEQKIWNSVGERLSGTEKGIRDLGRLFSGRKDKHKQAVGEQFTGSYQGARDIIKGLVQQGLNIKMPGGPISPGRVIEILLKAYCQLLRDRGVVNLPDYCYSYLIVPRGHKLKPPVSPVHLPPAGIADPLGQVMF